MSRLSDLLREVEAKDPQLAIDLKKEVEALSARRSFGLNFERHIPETVELPGRPIRKGDKVRFLLERGAKPGSVDRRLWQVTKIRRTKDGREAELVRRGGDGTEAEVTSRMVENLVVVAEFRDPIYPGLKPTGKVKRGGDKPFHTVINSENYHALQALLYTHEAQVDAIYIDPPYNTRDKDWKYNNDYVDPDDNYRHSKWLAMMERRLTLARRLLNPDDSVLIITIDEKEYLRLGLLLEQSFPEARIQMVSVTTNPKGTSRPDMFARVDEFIFFALIGRAVVPDVHDDSSADKAVRWRYLRREDDESTRGTRPRQFYPVFVDPETSRIVDVGEPIAPDVRVESVEAPSGLVAVLPVREDGAEMEWGLTGPSLMRAASDGFARATPGHAKQPFIISYLTAPNIKRVTSGQLKVSGVREDGSKIVVHARGKASRPKTVWQESRHSAGDHGTKMLGALTPNRRFPFPKSVYAVEDTLRFFVANKPDAVVLDFFAGSGTTAHALMRLNKQDGGQRQCVLVTNNEVSADEQSELREKGLRPGDPEWEALGICDFITRPRVTAAVTGKTPEGKPIKGDYKFTDEFPMSEGFEENVESFTMSYEAPRRVAHHREFEAIAPLLWLKAGSKGSRIEKATETFDMADAYGILFDLDASDQFLAAITEAPSVRMVFIVTDDDRGFQIVCGELPAHVEAVRLYDSYLTNFTINTASD